MRSRRIMTEVVARIVVTVNPSAPKSDVDPILIPGAEVPRQCHIGSAPQVTHLRDDPKVRRSGVVRVIVTVMVTVRTRAVRSLLENTSLDHHQGGKLFLFSFTSSLLIFLLAFRIYAFGIWNCPWLLVCLAIHWSKDGFRACHSLLTTCTVNATRQHF